MATRVLLTWLALCLAVSAEPAIKPKKPPVVVQGGSFQFTADRPVTWSMGPGSKGSIDQDGMYHAPAQVEAQQSLGGCQVLPNDHIFNTRVDNLPRHPKSDLWMNARDAQGRIASGGSPGYLPATQPVNIISSKLPAQDTVFAYTPQYNGGFRIPAPPDLKVESGVYALPFGGMDRHIVMLETDTCTFEELYNLYPRGTNVARKCPDCTSQSGVRYSGMTYALPNAATDAAGMYLTPLSLHRDEILAGRINHALRTTVTRNFASSSHIWPATTQAGSNHADTFPFGARLRLKSSFVSPSKNPYTQTLIRQLKEYGLIMADIGGQWGVSLEDVDIYYDPQIIEALKEVNQTVPVSNFEVVDESSLMVNPFSGETTEGAETVIATDKASGKTASLRVVLAGATIGTDTQYLVFQAGALPHRLKAWVNGSNDKAISWEMTPATGNLSADGVYTPPSKVSKVETFSITAQMKSNRAVATSIAVTVLPPGTIRIDNGNLSTYTDSKGNLWSQNCCTPSAKAYTFGGYKWPKLPDIKLYEDVAADWQDIPFNMYVKPGDYRITAKMAEASNTSPGARSVHLESQGQLVYRNVDLFAMAGIRNPIDFDLPALVGPDGKLAFYVRHVTGEVAYIAALQIAPDSGGPRIQLLPADGGDVRLLQQRQFYATRWFLPNPALEWSLSPPLGHIDANGLYTAPSTPVPQDTRVTVTARSAANPSLTASSSITIKTGIPTIRINCGGAEFTDAQGRVWGGDQHFEGGTTFGAKVDIAGASPDMQPLYRDSRYDYATQSFSYSFPIPDGSYRVKLMWAEYRTAAQVAAQHMGYKMKVTINGKTVLTNFDPIAAAGGVQKAYDQIFTADVSQSEMRIVFSGEPGAGYVGSAVNGIEIEPVQAARAK